jgi:hypothetical protein
MKAKVWVLCTRNMTLAPSTPTAIGSFSRSIITTRPSPASPPIQPIQPRKISQQFRSRLVGSWPRASAVF